MKTLLYYEERGSGFPLILLHGNNEDHTYFKHIAPILSENYRVIMPDTRGHGQSERGSVPFTLNQFADDLKQFLDELSLSKVHLLGFSDGGNIALLFCIKYPEYVDKLIINGANRNPLGVKSKFQIPIVLNWAKASTSLVNRSKYEMLNLMVTQPHITNQQLHSILSPTLVIAGSNDMIKSSETESIAKNISCAKLCILDGDHFIAGRKTTAPNFAKQVLDFLQK